jgi:16S rRNA (uracil1498-N3)-methyltransferase
MVPVVLEIAVLKGDAMEWVIEKATELGIRSVQPILTDHTVIQIKNKGPSFFQERWQKIADQALKQCGRLDRLKVETPVALEDLLLRKPAVDAWIRFWCDEQQRNGGRGTLADWILAPGSEFPPDVKIMIGPEGGWSPQERVILKKYCDDLPGRVISVGLGPLVLRAETAAIFAMSLTSAFIRAGLS